MIPGGTKHVIQLHPFYPAYFVIGKKGAGKSALLERILEVYYQENYQVLDMNSAADLESLQWAVADPNKEGGGRAYPILVILPITTQMTITHPRKIKLADGREVDAVKTILDTTSLQEIILEAQKEKRIIVFSIHLYDSEVKGQQRFASYIKTFPKIVRDKLPKTLKFAIGIRELSDLSSNRMLSFAGSGEKESKRSLNYFSRVARHSRTVLALDMQDPDQVYSALVAQEDFILVKRMNKHHIPEKLHWLQEDIKRQLDYAKQHYLFDRLSAVSLDRVTNNSFYCVWPDGEYSLEHNSEPSFKHHASDDDALELAGVAIKYLSKSELEGTDESKIEEIKKKREEEAWKDKALSEAIRLHEEELLTWEECAKKVGWLVKDLPSANALKMAVNRYKDRQSPSEPHP
jgi:molybdopterin-guanine dinucleotide biosynthesis protein